MAGTLQQVLDKPIAWKDWSTDASVESVLLELQANILKGHGRDWTHNFFLSFEGLPTDAAQDFVRDIATLTTSALHQLRIAAAFKTTGVRGGRVLCFLLSAAGYRALGITPPEGAAFNGGMRSRTGVLTDPAPEDWQGDAWTAPAGPDAMVLLANDDTAALDRDIEDLKAFFLARHVRLLGEEPGRAYRRRQKAGAPKGEGIEHFGYADGRSQPLFLAEDLREELGIATDAGVAAKLPTMRWRPDFKPSQFIVPDPQGATAFACGSYFVFRKLEQNVRGFKEAEAALGEALGNGERAGAMVVGRFEDGTPLVDFGEAQGGTPVNDFNYDDDIDGARCPFRSHVRKTNPRGDVRRQFKLPDDRGDRGPIMARRGITYGDRRTVPPDDDFAEDDRPERDVGLLFMAYMADIEKQFEFTQVSWVNNPAFLRIGTDIDPVLGRRDPNAPPPVPMSWSDGHGTGPTVQQDF